LLLYRYGHACHANSNDGSGCLSGGNCDPNKYMSRDEAMKWLMADLKVASDHVRNYVKVPLTTNQYAALVSFTFNAGGGNFGGSTLLKMLNAGNIFTISIR
jgi:GH24 family phage-related lysozyme (muramidase)